MYKYRDLIVAIYLFAVAALYFGWILNLIKLIHEIFLNHPITTLFVARLVGAFVLPLGGILGFF